jgi:hypothetical protein
VALLSLVSFCAGCLQHCVAVAGSTPHGGGRPAGRRASRAAAAGLHGPPRAVAAATAPPLALAAAACVSLRL